MNIGRHVGWRGIWYRLWPFIAAILFWSVAVDLARDGWWASRIALALIWFGAEFYVTHERRRAEWKAIRQSDHYRWLHAINAQRRP